MDQKTRAAFRAVRDMMWDQMYGTKPTEWTYGNEHDRMREAYGLLDGLLEKDAAEKKGERAS